MSLDIRTLLVAVALANIFCMGARVLLWRTHPAVPGLGRWALAGGLGALGFVLILAHGSTLPLPSVSLAQLAIGAGLVIVWDGFRRFVGRPPLAPRALAILASLVVALAVVGQLESSLRVQAASNAALIASFSALIARDLFAAARPLQVTVRATAWLYAANAAFFLIRAVVVARSTGPVGPVDPDGLAALPLLWWLGMTIAITLGMVLMTGERLQSDLDAQVHRDPLTGAYNRRAFSSIANEQIEVAHRQGRPLSALMIDLDEFKRINDHHGHGVGDTLLCRFVAVAEQILRGQDVLCRFGGEEFVALLPDTSADRALVAAERLRTAFAADSAAMESTNNTAFPLTVSIGVGELRAGEGIDSLLRRADAALYRAKDLGRNRCELADSAPTTATPIPGARQASQPEG
ncbi:MAG TPA: GGDEF domain-containing protein [Gammaproteobacteria bacterium]|nr:GGDEF domain-containing protein [Gammaproteobacteria bacterium]